MNQHGKSECFEELMLQFPPSKIKGIKISEFSSQSESNNRLWHALCSCSKRGRSVVLSIISLDSGIENACMRSCKTQVSKAVKETVLVR
ncbi:MAG: hypothetical protein JWM11_1024 [Planctomycetaceae bacterium]|nr:hypothetical protein [Planctomycetaceae bacterium]